MLADRLGLGDYKMPSVRVSVHVSPCHVFTKNNSLCHSLIAISWDLQSHACHKCLRHSNHMINFWRFLSLSSSPSLSWFVIATFVRREVYYDVCVCDVSGVKIVCLSVANTIIDKVIKVAGVQLMLMHVCNKIPTIIGPIVYAY